VPDAAPSGAQTVAPGLITRQLDRDEIAALLKRGENFIRSGDLASARLVLQRAAEAGDMHAALTLAATFDPNLFQEDQRRRRRQRPQDQFHLLRRFIQSCEGHRGRTQAGRG
jgi:hypothetical protein